MNKILFICSVYFLVIVIVNDVYAQHEQLLTKAQIVDTVNKVENQMKPMELIWGITETFCNNDEWFITIHREIDNAWGPAHKVAIYKKLKDKFQLLKEIDSDGMFLEPQLFWSTPQGEKYPERLLQLTEVQFGTGHIVTEHIFLLSCPTDFKPVTFTPAPQTFGSRLDKEEGVWKGEINEFSDQGLFFTFYIWNKEDRNCCPSAGKVTGRYKLVRNSISNQLAIFAEEAKREPSSYLSSQ